MFNLSNLCVLVTRPRDVGKELCLLIQQYRGEAIHIPTIDILPPNDIVAFEDALSELGRQDWLIFISPQAVYSSIRAISRAWAQLPSKVHLAAIGAGTAKALKETGYVVTIYPSKEWNSEGLLALPEFQDVTKKKIAIIKGEGGREELEKTLITRGAEVSPIIAYRRVLPNIEVDVYHELFKRHKIDVLVCTSGEGMKNLKTLFANTDWRYIKNLPLIVVSERMKMLAHDLGFQTIWLARNASHEAIFEILQERRNELCQIKQMKS